MGSLRALLSLYLAPISNDLIAAAADSPLCVSLVAVFGAEPMVGGRGEKGSGSLEAAAGYRDSGAMGWAVGP